MPVDSPAEKMLIKLLIQNKLMTKPQVTRVVKKTVSVSEKTLHEEIVDLHFVDPAIMPKILSAIKKKGYHFPLLSEQTL